MKKNDLKIDESVKVKNGILCPDLKEAINMIIL
jgi:hypothetical protein